ncbi:hypothetical protein DB459_13890 [Bradyrhizobium sp. WD16]|jgi:XRE family aerobic/anaerobic benzoate catabolism transcriptional regulator|nr:hypothetical protein DB459_13890 [Bradyrhizobium sp. WD16]
MRQDLATAIPLNVRRPQPSVVAPDFSPDRSTERQFLGQLGQRVRAARGRQGLSRKALAKASGISERYIAQLETGKGNMSIVLLRRISNALEARLSTLLPVDETIAV